MSPRSVLIIEDEADYRNIARQLLEEAGFEVREAANAALGLKELREKTPDLVLLDVGLPDRLGTDVCRALRDDPATTELPVILFTVRSELAQVSEGLACGADDYILKPFDPDDFLARVRGVLADGKG